MTYDTIENAFDFVSGAPPCERSAVINRKTGEIVFGVGPRQEAEMIAKSVIFTPKKNHGIGMASPYSN